MPFENEKTYHIYNNLIDPSLDVFVTNEHCERAVITSKYYQFDTLPLKLSVFLSQSLKGKEEVLSDLIKEADRIVEIVAYCFIPKRLEFLLTQKKDDGISTFMSRFQNSYTRYYNSKEERKGSIFDGQFKAKPVEKQDIVNISKNIHQLPSQDPLNYRWSSIKAYSEKKPVFVNPEKVLSNFDSPDEYRNFVSQT